VEATDKPPDAAVSNAVWLRGYDSDDANLKATALGMTGGIMMTVKSFIPPSECPGLKKVSGGTIADETAKVIRADMNFPLVIATIAVLGHEIGCPAAVRRWVERAHGAPTPAR